jgi:hypothetical protein
MSVQNVQNNVNHMMHMFEHLAKDIDAKQIIDDIHNEIGELPAIEKSWSVFARDINRTLDISAIVIKHAVLFVGYAKVYKVHNEFAEDLIKHINYVHNEINLIRNSKCEGDTI